MTKSTPRISQLSIVPIAIVLISLWAAVSCDDEEEYFARVLKCDTNDATRKIDCSRLGIIDLTTIKFAKEEGTLEVDFGKNEIKALVAGTFVDKNNALRLLDLSHNRIVFVSDNVFENLTKLQNLDLSDNKIANLPIDFFYGLSYLTKLDLRSNELYTLDADTFKPVHELKELFLGRNKINSINDLSFTHLPRLEHLDLEDCGLSSLPDELFASNQRLHELLLAKNAFEVVPTKALQSARALSVLDLSSTQVTQVEYADFARMQNLRQLHLCQCPALKSIGAAAFQDLIDLEQFVCEYNPKLTRIHPSAFTSNLTGEPIEKLNILRLKGNALAALDERTVPWTRLSRLDLRSNPWRCDCNLRWIRSLFVANSSTSFSEVLTSDEKDDGARKDDFPGVEVGASRGGKMSKFLLGNCSQPFRNKGKAISQMDVKDFRCPLFGTDIAVVEGVFITVFLSMALTLVGYILVRLGIVKPICRRLSPNRREGGYVRVVPSKDKVDIEWNLSGEASATNEARGNVRT